MLAEVVYCPACWGPGQLKMDKYGRPYLRCGSGCRIFTNGPDAIGALTVIAVIANSWLRRTARRIKVQVDNEPAHHRVSRPA